MFCLKNFFIYKLENWIWSISRGMILKVIFHGLKLRLIVRDYGTQFLIEMTVRTLLGGAYTETPSYTWENH